MRMTPPDNEFLINAFGQIVIDMTLGYLSAAEKEYEKYSVPKEAVFSSCAVIDANVEVILFLVDADVRKAAWSLVGTGAFTWKDLGEGLWVAQQSAFQLFSDKYIPWQTVLSKPLEDGQAYGLEVDERTGHVVFTLAGRQNEQSHS